MTEAELLGAISAVAYDFNDLQKMGVVLKRALYFITCSGKMMYPTKIEEDYIARNLLSTKEKLPREIREMGYKQLSLFDDVRFGGGFDEKRICL